MQYSPAAQLALDAHGKPTAMVSDCVWVSIPAVVLSSPSTPVSIGTAQWVRHKATTPAIQLFLYDMQRIS